jgi:hypothetical protein
MSVSVLMYNYHRDGSLYHRTTRDMLHFSDPAVLADGCESVPASLGRCTKFLKLLYAGS